jgi:hypothetical protein
VDLSVAGNHVLLSAGTLALAAATSSSPAYLSGSTASQLVFPYVPASYSAYSLFYVARYKPSGGAKGRIVHGCSLNWLSGFHGYYDPHVVFQRGVAYHGFEWVTPEADLNLSLDQWVSSSDRCTNYRANGIDKTLASVQNAACDGNRFRGDQICINTGLAGGQTSDFDIQALLQYNRALSDAEVAQVEVWLGYACPAGSYLNASAVRQSAFPCTSCPSGTWSVTVGATSSATCVACAAGSNSAPGMTTCLSCSAGSFVDASALACSACPAGTYAAAASQTACTICSSESSSTGFGCISSGIHLFAFLSKCIF